MNNQDNQCALGIHCHGEGKIQAHAVELNILVCVKCVAREEKLTMKQKGPPPTFAHDSIGKG